MLKKKNAICRPYIVSINTDEDGQQIPVWCNITDETIKDADFDINSFKNADSIMLALNVRNNQAYGQHGLKDVAGHLNVAGMRQNGGGNFKPPNSYANGNYFQDNTFGGKIKFVHETRSNYMIRWINESNKGTIDWHDINNWPGDAWYITRHIVVERKQTFLAVKNIYKTQIIAYNSIEDDDDILGKIPSKNGWTEPAGANQGINPPSSTISVTKDLSMRENFSNMKNNKLNPQNLTFDDDIPMKVYYGLLGVGGIYLLYQLSKKYGNKLNLDQ